MKTVFLHGLGQSPHDWKEVISQTASSDVDCPELFSQPEDGMAITYSRILTNLEKRYANTIEPFRICGLSLGAVLALDYAIRHGDRVASLVLIGGQYKMPRLIIDVQNLVFRCMPTRVFRDMGMSKSNTIQLVHSMRTLDFSAKLKTVICPVAVVCGERDRVNRKAAKKLKGLLPQGALYLIPGAGHEVNKCAPEAISVILNT